MTCKYDQRVANSCGPDAFAFAAQLDQNVVDNAWDIDDINQFHDLKDSPWHHFVVAESLGIPFRTLTLAQVLAGDFQQDRCMTLIHDPENPLLAQHWIVVHSIEGDKVRFYDGKRPLPVQVSKSLMTSMYAAGSPACAYELGRGDQKTTWYQRWYVWLTNRIFGG